MSNHNYDWKYPKKFGMLIDSDWFKAADALTNGGVQIKILSGPTVKKIEVEINNKWYHRIIAFVTFGLLCEKRTIVREVYEYQCKIL